MADKSTTELELLITARSPGFDSTVNQANSKLGTLGSTANSTGGALGSLGGAMSKFSVLAAAATIATNVLTKGFEDMLAKEDQLADFSAITGVTGAKLQEFGSIATDLSNKFGASVTENIEAFKGTLSRLGPGFASSTIAVEKMGESINTLSVASGLDATESMNALTTAMLQFGVDLSNPIMAANEGADMMNVMAAAAKEGAAEIPQIAEALVVAGTSARAAGVSFEETNAAIQMLATGGIYGAEAGTALRNVFVRLQAPTQEARDQMNAFGIDAREVGVALTTQGLGGAMTLLQEKFKNIADPVDRAALLNKIFGESAQNAAQVLMEKSGPAFTEFTGKISDTVVAQEQAAVKMDTLSAKFGRLTTMAQNVVSQGLQGMIDHLQRTILLVTDFIGLTGDEAPRNLKREKESIDKVVEGYNILNPQLRESISNEEKRKLAIENAAKSAEQAAAREEKAKKPKTGKAGKSPLELENEAFDKARIGIAKLHNEWTGFADTVDITAAQMQDVGGAQLVDSLEEQDTIVNRLIVGYGSLGLTIGSVADLFTSAFSGGGDALTGVLKQMGNMFITFVEGAILAGSAFASVSAILTAGISAIKDAPLLAAAIIALEAGRGYINSLAVGTTNVPHDQLAMVHRGESVIPRTFNEGIQRGEMALVGRGKAESPSQTIRQQRAGAFDVTARIDESGFRSVSSRDTYRRGARTF